MLKLDKPNSAEAPAKSNLSYWLSLVDEQFRKKSYTLARDFILRGLVDFPNHPLLLDRLFIVDRQWNLPIAGNRIHLVIPKESDLSFFQQCYANAEFMDQFLPMGRKNQNAESILFALKNSEFSVVQFKTKHWVIKKEEREGLPQNASETNLKSIGLASLVDIQIAHRRAELLVGIPDKEDRKQAAAVIATLLIFDFAFNQISLHKLTSIVIANNLHSQRSTESIGFIQEGLRRQHLRDPKSRMWLDCYENGMIENNFRENGVIARLSQRLLGRNITVKHF
ncbi:GNAT family protein [Nitrosomonas sp. Is37]|uniref:GNAT family N-acetyltransferase n=1 Tax=Nitrosomonas sp. Is37 TaxID=3080535 RepID=UPI00294B0950|nr:GNAT family protein [Nitrosomonas sp. Is37]MDV6343980.1 GNAT family protein [Nitrosomonas sp. Is37]